MGHAQHHKRHFCNFYKVSYLAQLKEFARLCNPKAFGGKIPFTVHNTQILVPFGQLELERIVNLICHMMNAKNMWELPHTTQPNSEVIFSIGFDAQVRRSKISLFTVTPIATANRHDGSLAYPVLSWLGGETKAWLNAVLSATSFEAQAARLQGATITCNGVPLAIRWALHCDNAAHHCLSNTSPPNAYTRSPQGQPCPWCTVTHAEIQEWWPDKRYRIANHNPPGAHLNFIAPKWRMPDYSLHGTRNCTNILWQAVLGVVKHYNGEAFSTSIA